MVEHTFFDIHFDVLFATGVAMVMTSVGLLWRKLTQQEINIKRLDHIEATQDEIKDTIRGLRDEMKEGQDKDDSDHARLWSKVSTLDSRISGLEAKIDMLLKRTT